MAENTIRKEDIIDAAGIIKSMLEVVDTIKSQLVPAIELINKTVKEEKATLETLNPALKEHQTILAQKVQSIQQFDAEQKKNNKTLSEVERLEQRLKELRKESAIDAERLRQSISKQTKDNRDLVASENAHEKSLTKLRLKLSELKQAYNDAEIGGKKQEKILKDLEGVLKQVTTAEQKMGVFTRNVGNYTSAWSGMGIKILDAGKSMLSFMGVTALATAFVDKVKDAIMSTTGAINAMNIIGAVTKQIFYDIAINGKFSAESILQVIEATKQLNELRTDEYEEEYKIAGINKELQELWFKSKDQTLDNKTRKEALIQVEEKENEIIKIKVDHLKKELIAVNTLANARKEDEKLMQRGWDIMKQIKDVQSEMFSSMKRVESQKTGFIEKEIKDRAELVKKWMDGLDEEVKAERDAAEARKKAATSILEKQFEENQKKNEKYADNIAIPQAQKVSNKLVEIKKQEIQKSQEAGQVNAEFQKSLSKDILQAKMSDVSIYLEFASQGIEILGNILEAQKQRELSAVGDNAEKRDKIEKEYRNKQKAISLSQAIINGALGVTKTFAEYGFTPLAWVANALLIASTAAQIAVIAAQKFAEGGEIKGKPHSQGGTIIEAEKGEYVINKLATVKYKGLIEAINKDDKMAIVEELRNRNFHMVWGGVQEQLKTVARQDPYTRLMYELMSRNMTTYIDSNGDTNIVYSNGYRRIVRKYEAS